ncbi:RNA polymerase sigma-70 factor [Cytophagaceae bacterium YF14B1]|uniref:RNA polymerase sigma-70 factor n=1 Tax=Xanthocytophaga flava TaxID=3048013 RepID=A0AAE3QV91_9BACT|nr:RNA polymerase sigma-70 factor [Xanthocytophaga flavus]MDJ1486037.1 RNA polymerase sigma-70 factor [Xanthocytophaga flavus]
MTPFHTEEDLIRQLKDGNQAAFKTIFHLYYRPLTLFAMKYVGDVEEAKEITQEFFIRFWEKHASVEINFSLKTYLYHSVRNACYNFIEKNKVAQRRLTDWKKNPFIQDPILDKIIAAEQEEILLKGIDSLPEKCKEIFIMSRIEKLSNKEIAAKLQISVKTVEGQITIALKRLKNLLISLLLSFGFLLR